jgi:hypothetical protein
VSDISFHILLHDNAARTDCQNSRETEHFSGEIGKVGQNKDKNGPNSHDSFGVSEKVVFLIGIQQKTLFFSLTKKDLLGKSRFFGWVLGTLFFIQKNYLVAIAQIKAKITPIKTPPSATKKKEPVKET